MMRPPGSPNADAKALFDEQVRLRAELERLKREHADLQKKVAENGSKEGESQEGGKGNGGDGKKGEGDQKGGDGKKGSEDKQGDEEQKPKEPATKRAGNWVRSHPVATILGLIGLVVLTVAGYFLIKYLGTFENTDDAQVDGHTDPISSRVAGNVVGVYVENTYRVKKGQVLVDLDPRDYEVALAQARANLSQAEASYRAQVPNVPIASTTQETQVINAQLSVSTAQAALLQAQHDVQSAAADLDQSEANAANAAREEERYRQLVGKQEVSREQYDQKATDARAQQALVASRRAAAQAAQKAVEQRQSALDQAQQQYVETKQNQPRQMTIERENLTTRLANLQAAKAQVDQAQLNLSYCKIVAPADGIVGDKSLQVGMHVQPGEEMLAITEINDLWVTANFKETQIRNMHPGESVTINVDALSEKFNGFVEELPGATGATYSLLPPENATGNYVKVVQRLPVRIRFKPGQPYEERLRPGMSVEPKVWVK